MPPIVTIAFTESGMWIKQIYEIVIPEFPGAGVAVVVLSALLFIFYLFKQGFKQAFKYSFLVLATLTFALFAIHTVLHLMRTAI